MTRVSVVGVSAGQVVLAPHAELRWLARDLANLCGAAPEVGQVGEFEEDSSSWIFEADPEWHVELHSLKTAGRPELMTFQINGTKTIIDLSDHGVPLAMKGKTAARLKFWLLTRHDGKLTAGRDNVPLQGHFDHPDITSWVAETEQGTVTEAQRKRDNQLLRRRRKFEDEPRGHFINPYIFVPFPAQPSQRDEPHGHHTLVADGEKRRLTGRITGRLVARSPLLVRNVGSAAPLVNEVARAPRTGTGELFIPGSSLHGAIRSLHETLTGSCLRVFDPDFVPVYRDIASATLRPGWDLGVVDDVDSGRPTRLIRCAETRWAPLTTLVRAMPTAGDAVTTGQRFRLAEKEFLTRNNRQVYREEASAVLDPDGEWVVLVTDDSARSRDKPYYCAVGRVPATPAPVALTDRAWHEYLRAAEGAKQSFAGEPTPNWNTEQEQLNQPGTSIGDVLGAPTQKWEHGRWLRPRRWFHRGQVVWLAPRQGQLVDGIALSYLWRTAGHGSAGQRLPDDGFQPCHDPGWLCPSCRVFGSADVRDVSRHGVDRRVAEQRSYRGHVRVLDAVMESGRPLDEPVVLPATGSPKPGSGQFYLDDPQGSVAPLIYQKPRNRWGTPDARQPRHLRGRKFYWHTDPRTDERRGRWRAHDHAPSGERVELVAAGSAYRLDLVFDGLTEAEIGSLIAALQPDRLFGTQPQPLPYPVTGAPEYAIHVGGGKPLGLGSCQVRDLRVVTDSAESRYLGAKQPALDPIDLVAAFVTEHSDLRSTWKDVAAALHTDHVDSRIVSYPTAVSWDDNNGTCSDQKQHEAFKWFQRTTGEKLRDGKQGRPFVPLPSVSDIAPVLPVNPEEYK